jgi:hypothetical protein
MKHFYLKAIGLALGFLLIVFGLAALTFFN